MSEVTVYNDFNGFCNKLRMSDYVVNNVRTRYQAITKRINEDFWSSTSNTNHSYYVGSYGRGTSIYTSDIDIIVELPWKEYSRFNDYAWNGQSSLLSAVRSSLMKTYSTSKISADGQVVDISFSDGVKFEVVPSFKYSDDSGFCYPDTNNGGSWKSMNPVLEMKCFNGRNSMTKGNLKKLCRMARAWKNEHQVLMSGILIDTTAYRFMQNYEYAENSYTYFDWMSRDYFKYLYDNAEKIFWDKPGEGYIKRKYSIKNDAKFAYEKACEAIEDAQKGYDYCWHSEWREIYGSKFPES